MPLQQTLMLSSFALFGTILCAVTACGQCRVLLSVDWTHVPTSCYLQMYYLVCICCHSCQSLAYLRLSGAAGNSHTCNAVKFRAFAPTVEEENESFVMQYFPLHSLGCRCSICGSCDGLGCSESMPGFAFLRDRPSYTTISSVEFFQSATSRKRSNARCTLQWVLHIATQHQKRLWIFRLDLQRMKFLHLCLGLMVDLPVQE